MPNFLYLLILTTLLSIPLKADEPILPYSYKIEGKGFTFVMLTDNDSINSNLCKKYLLSGLYKSDNDSIPVWQVKWWSYRSDIFITSDGKYLVRLGNWASLTKEKERNLNQLAVEFYENGRLLKSNNISDLINLGFLLPKTVSHYNWLKWSKFTEDKFQFEIGTESFQKFTFDIRTGEIKTKIDYLLVFIIALIIISSFVIFYRISIKTRKRAHY